MKQPKSLFLLLCIFLLINCNDTGRKQTANIVHTDDYHEGRARVMTSDGKYGYIDRDQQMAIPTIYDFASDFHESLAIVGTAGHDGTMTYHTIDAEGNTVFGIALDSCLIGTEYHDGLLWYMDMRTGHEGYLDREGHPTTARPSVSHSSHIPSLSKQNQKDLSHSQQGMQQNEMVTITTNNWHEASPQNPFYQEAQKVIAGKLTEEDASNRTMILNYVEHLRTSYTTKDIDFLQQLFSEKALIIVGHVVRPAPNTEVKLPPQVNYNIISKQRYLQRLREVFATNKKIDVHFSDFAIRRHPTVDGIYGVSLRQRYRSDRYADDGYLFLLWDFRDKTAPKIHVRTWQAAITGSQTPLPRDSIIGLQDFNLR